MGFWAPKSPIYVWWIQELKLWHLIALQVNNPKRMSIRHMQHRMEHILCFHWSHGSICFWLQLNFLANTFGVFSAFHFHTQVRLEILIYHGINRNLVYYQSHMKRDQNKSKWPSGNQSQMGHNEITTTLSEAREDSSNFWHYHIAFLTWLFELCCWPFNSQSQCELGVTTSSIQNKQLWSDCREPDWKKGLENLNKHPCWGNIHKSPRCSGIW
jgi:hypothetical protein